MFLFFNDTSTSIFLPVSGSVVIVQPNPFDKSTTDYNVNSNRQFIMKSGEKVEWSMFLEKIERHFPGKLCAPHVCRASLNEVYIANEYYSK